MLSRPVFTMSLSSQKGSHGRLVACWKASAAVIADRRQEVGGGVLRDEAGSGERGAAGEFWDVGASGDAGGWVVYGVAHPGDHAGDLRVPEIEGDRRAVVPGEGHARGGSAGDA